MEQITKEFKNGSIISHVYPEYPDGFYKAYLMTDKTNDRYNYIHFGTNVRGYLYLDTNMLGVSDVMRLCDIMEPYVDDKHLTTDKNDVQTYRVGNAESGTTFIIGNGHTYISSDVIQEEDREEIERLLDLDNKLIK